MAADARARFLSLAWSKLRLYSANHRPGYFSNRPCDWPSKAWVYSEQETENGLWPLATTVLTLLSDTGPHVSDMYMWILSIYGIGKIYFYCWHPLPHKLHAMMKSTIQIINSYKNKYEIPLDCLINFLYLTRLPLDKTAAVLADNIFKHIFLNEKVWFLTKISLKFISKHPIDNYSALV